MGYTWTEMISHAILMFDVTITKDDKLLYSLPF